MNNIYKNWQKIWFFSFIIYHLLYYLLSNFSSCCSQIWNFLFLKLCFLFWRSGFKISRKTIAKNLFLIFQYFYTNKLLYHLKKKELPKNRKLVGHIKNFISTFYKKMKIGRKNVLMIQVEKMILWEQWAEIQDFEPVNWKNVSFYTLFSFLILYLLLFLTKLQISWSPSYLKNNTLKIFFM